jgi:hypothetical protein
MRLVERAPEGKGSHDRQHPGPREPATSLPPDRAVEEKRLDAIEREVRQLVEGKRAGLHDGRVRPRRQDKKKAAPEGGYDPGSLQLANYGAILAGNN